ncbi:MAG TPA: hypothetical protein VL049_09065 [Candidatus Dormibacteraeota bacterium]|nr:hypothetical protein [Candidatus Dormibacteraeota bacterium]
MLASPLPPAAPIAALALTLLRATTKTFAGEAGMVAGVRGTVLSGDTTLDAICALQGTVTCVTKMAAGETKPLVPTRDELARYLKEVSLDAQ